MGTLDINGPITEERVDRVARGHEQAVALRPAKADVGGALRQADVTDRGALRIEDADAIKLGRAHAPAAPKIAVDVDAEAVRRLVLRANDQLLAVRELGAIGHVERVDGALARLALDHIEF